MRDLYRPVSFVLIRPFSIFWLLRYASRYDLAELARPTLGTMNDGASHGFVHKRRVRCIEMFLLLNLVSGPLVRIGCVFYGPANALQKARTRMFRTRESRKACFLCICRSFSAILSSTELTE